MSAEGFRKELEHLINRESRENGSNTPDWMLAEYLVGCLAAFDKAVNDRERWYGRANHLIVSVPDGEMPSSPSDPGDPTVGAP